MCGHDSGQSLGSGHRGLSAQLEGIPRDHTYDSYRRNLTYSMLGNVELGLLSCSKGPNTQIQGIYLPKTILAISNTRYLPKTIPTASTRQLPFKISHIATNRDHKALYRGTLGGLGSVYKSRYFGP